MSERLSRVAVLVTLAALAGCLKPARRVEVNGPAMRERMAVMALLREDFETARQELLDLAAKCEAREHGRRAVLLLAAAELDTENEAGSPGAAARLARSYLLLPNAPRDEIVLARALYRVAVDLGGLEEEPDGRALTIAPRFDECSGPSDLRFHPPPTTPEETLADRLQALEARLAAQSDSLASLRAQSDSLALARTAAERSRQRVAELEQELDRITQLLTSGAERRTESDR